ncbi:MAG TPA: PEGA domain-containing protein [Kofleriaceae bacterium]|jgi:hypothetical protein
MNRVAVAMLLVCTAVCTAGAAPKHKVKVETEPAGATVYVGEKENGPSCDATPCSIELPVGESTIIIELSGYVQIFKTITVPKRGTVKLDSFAMEKAIGHLTISGPKGATIIIDDEDKGKAPQDFDLPVGQYSVKLVDGKRTGTAFVSFESGGDEKELDDAAITWEGAEAQTEDPEERPEVHDGAHPAHVDAPLFSIEAIGTVGFRSFKYQGNRTKDSLRDLDEKGAFIVGVSATVYPGTLFQIPALRTLALFGSFQLPANKQGITGDMIAAGVTNLWQSFSAGLSYKYVLDSGLGIGASFAWVRDDYQYSGRQQDRDVLPFAEYKTVAPGLGLSYATVVSGTHVEPYVGAEYRIVYSAEPMASRFLDTKTAGVHVALGANALFGKHITAHVEAGLLRYAWSYKADPSAMLPRMATGATDQTFQIAFSVGYAY